MQVLKNKEPILSLEAAPVLLEEFGPNLETEMSKMLELMYASGGVGLAGPQVNISKRILVADLSYVSNENYGYRSIKMVNPEVVSYSEEIVESEEGCLSFPGLAIKVSRPVAVRVNFLSPLGERKEQTFIDWSARIILHEIDHLNGVTLYSRASTLKRQRYNKRLK